MSTFLSILNNELEKQRLILHRVKRELKNAPKGFLRARKRIFFTLTFLGSLVWSYLLVYVGVKMGENMEAFKHIWHKFDVAIVVIFGILGCLYVYKHFKHLSIYVTSLYVGIIVDIFSVAISLIFFPQYSKNGTEHRFDLSYEGEVFYALQIKLHLAR